MWLQNLEHIYIDPARCPNAAREFAEYEYEQDANGSWRADYPDRDDHTMDATRYSLERHIRGETFRIKNKR